jgi:hypothetical protein
MNTSFPRLIAGVGLVIVLFVGGAAAAQPDPEAIDPEAGLSQLTEGEARIVQRIAEQLDVPVEQVLRLRARGLGWGDIEMALLLADHGGESPGRIVAMWQADDRQWQSVGDRLGIDDVEALKAGLRKDD